MARSRRPQKRGKCPCGRTHTVYIGEHTKRRGKKSAGCTILEYIDEHNVQFLKFRERRSHLIEED